MDSIKKKMMSLTTATEEATERAEKFELEVRRVMEVADRYEEQVRNIQKKMQIMEGSFDCCTEQLFEVVLKLEEKEKAYGNSEGEVGSLAMMSHRADNAIRKRQALENSNSSMEEQNDKLENQVKDDKFTLQESERKYEDIFRKCGTMEGELERSNERCQCGEKKITDLEEELRVVGQNLQSLEVSEEKALQREEDYQRQINELVKRLKVAEWKEEASSMNVQRLNIRIDQIEEDLLNEKLKIKTISDDLDQTFTDMLTNF